MTKMRMSERKATVAGMLIVSMFIGCSHERNIGKAAQARTHQSHAAVIDHFVPQLPASRAEFLRDRRQFG